MVNHPCFYIWQWITVDSFVAAGAPYKSNAFRILHNFSIPVLVLQHVFPFPLEPFNLSFHHHGIPVCSVVIPDTCARADLYYTLQHNLNRSETWQHTLTQPTQISVIVLEAMSLTLTHLELEDSMACPWPWPCCQSLNVYSSLVLHS